MYKYYKELLLEDYPSFLDKYLECPSIVRLKSVGYFCGMDYASKDIYDFGEYISRFDHSLDVALITWKYTKDKTSTLAGLIHDIATPCFAHVIDYMNKDYANQESTEEYTEKIIMSDKKLINYFLEDGINIQDVINFKKHPIVDNDRPKLCADRLDGVILTGMFWTKNVSKEDALDIIKHTTTFINEDNEVELGFDDIEVAKKVLEVGESIDKICHSNEDNYMMELLAYLTRYLIDNNIITYDDLYILDVNKMHYIFSRITDKEFKEKYNLFKNIKKEDIPINNLPNVKKRDLKILVNGNRLSI